MAYPQFVGYGPAASDRKGITVAPTPGLQAGDYEFLVCETMDEAVTTPSGWSFFMDYGVTNETLCSVFYRINTPHDSSDVSIADPGDHIIAFRFAYRGVTNFTAAQSVGFGDSRYFSVPPDNRKMVTAALIASNSGSSNDPPFAAGSLSFTVSYGTSVANGGGIGLQQKLVLWNDSDGFNIGHDLDSDRLVPGVSGKVCLLIEGTSSLVQTEYPWISAEYSISLSHEKVEYPEWMRFVELPPIVGVFSAAVDSASKKLGTLTPAALEVMLSVFPTTTGGGVLKLHSGSPGADGSQNLVQTYHPPAVPNFESLGFIDPDTEVDDPVTDCIASSSVNVVYNGTIPRIEIYAQSDELLFVCGPVSINAISLFIDENYVYTGFFSSPLVLEAGEARYLSITYSSSIRIGV